MTENIEDPQDNDENLVDEATSGDSTVPVVQYDITTFGADYDVEGLVKRLNRGDIIIPPFQRNYVWNIAEASRFIESLLLGLPVPSIFLAREQDTNKLLVIDGQQRLKTLEFFYKGYFNPKEGQKADQVFKLIKVQSKFEGKTYEMLDDQDKIKLNDSLIHAIIIKQESPKNDNTSVYHIFDRLNSEGRILTPQEIRTAVDHGDFIDLLKSLNDHDSWRKIYGKASNRLKDQELILRFLALYFESEQYEKPMQEFLNKFSHKHRNPTKEFLEQCGRLFRKTIDLVFESIGKQAFKPGRGVNAAAFDSVMVGLAKRNERGDSIDLESVRAAYEKLFTDDEYAKLISYATSDEANVKQRIIRATELFDSIK